MVSPANHPKTRILRILTSSIGNTETSVGAVLQKGQGMQTL